LIGFSSSKKYKVNTYRSRFFSSVISFTIVLNFLVFAAKAEDKEPKFKVIAFFSANWDLGHISFAHEANMWFPKIAKQYNFTYDSTNNWSNLNDSFLSTYQVVIFLDNQPPAEQRIAFKKYIENGGGWMGFHVVAFNQNPMDWDWYYNQFLGMGSYKGNTWAPTSAVLRVENKTHPATKNLPETFKASPNEWYSWTVDLREKPNIKILCSIDSSSFPLGTGPKLFEIWHNGYYPVVWTNTNYKMIYFNMGHNVIDYANNNATTSWTFNNDIQNKLIINSLLWLGNTSYRKK
jgi:uncharacterized protein